MDSQPSSPYVYSEDVSEPAGPYVSHDEVEERSLPDPEGRDVIIVDGRAMSYRAYHRR